MKVLLFCLIFPVGLWSQTQTSNVTIRGFFNGTDATYTKVKTGLADPGTCGEGELFFNLTEHTLKQCTATNTWNAIASGITPQSSDGSITITNPSSSTPDFEVNSADYLARTQYQLGSDSTFIDSGGDDAYVVAAPLSGTVCTGLEDGMRVWLKVSTTNTGAATLNICVLGAKTIVANDNTTLTDGAIATGRFWMLTFDETNDVFRMPPTGGGSSIWPTTVDVITSSQTWNKPSNVSRVFVRVWGAGGGGDFGANGGGTAGNGGAGGGYAEGWVEVSGNQTVTIGAGGAGGVVGVSNPTDGGDTSFGSLMSAIGGGNGRTATVGGRAGYVSATSDLWGFGTSTDLSVRTRAGVIAGSPVGVYPIRSDQGGPSGAAAATPTGFPNSIGYGGAGGGGGCLNATSCSGGTGGTSGRGAGTGGNGGGVAASAPTACTAGTAPGGGGGGGGNITSGGSGSNGCAGAAGRVEVWY